MLDIGINGSLQLGVQSLNAQQTVINTIGNNIANVNTPGYADQRANLATDVISNEYGSEDLGVSVSNIESLRSPLLDTLVQQSLGNQGFADNQASLTSTVQSSLGEQFSSAGTTTSSGVVSGSGPIQDAMSNFFSALQSLASTPSDATSRQVVVQDAQALSTAFNGAYQRMQQSQSDIAADATSITTQVNQLSQSIAALNEQITQIQAASGTSPNNLCDTRQADVETLSGLVNITTTTQPNGAINIALADNPTVALVSGSKSNGTGGTQSLSASYSATASVPLTISGSTTGALGTGVPSGGSLGADLNVANDVIGSPGADGNTGILGQLDSVANQLISQVNTQNKAGFDLNGNAGGAIFSGSGAGDIAVVANVANNPSLIAAGNGSGPLDGSNAEAMAQIQTQAAITPAIQTMVSNLGQTVSTAESNQTTMDQVTQQLQTQRNSVSGVSIDQEMTNLISFQQSYDASARFITIISNLYNTLIEKTGVT